MSNRTVVAIETDLGAISVEIDADAAPITAANFLYYVDEGAYDGGAFYRTVTAGNQPNDAIRIAVIEADLNPHHPRDDMKPIPLERTCETGLFHFDGTISMGRDEPDTALADFFICVGDQPDLDYGGRRNPDGQGFAAFGRVIAGMDVVRQIQAGDNIDQRLEPPVLIRRIRRR